MDKYLIHNFLGIQGFHIAWYGFLTVMGIVGGIILAIQRMRKQNTNVEMLIDILLGMLPLSFVGARLYYVAFHWSEYAGDMQAILNIRDGGQALYGSVIGGLIGTWIVCRIRRYSLLSICDWMFPCLLVGQIIGRWGNFVNQEAYGRLITNEHLQFFPVGVYIDALGQWRQATFFYEALWNLCVLVLILFLEMRWHQKGMVTALYMIGYGTGRFMIEGLRADSLYLTEGIRVSQLLSGILVILGVFWLYRIFHRSETDSKTELKTGDSAAKKTGTNKGGSI
ncbi:MAG: prolipoprotein diacylglyceryl transferase [Hespellia sp.]|nr:prolipoprotein diacylglyceryl transferase [Hespellia sp.]